MMGLPLDKVAPKDLEAAFDPNSVHAGTYGSSRLTIRSRAYPNILQLLGRSTKTLASGQPLTEEAVGINRGMSGSVVWHEATHMLLNQLEKTQYAAFQKKMQNNMEPILGYMGSRPDIFQAYDGADVGGAFYYLTRLITGKNVFKSQGRAEPLMPEANAYRLRNDLPLTVEQKAKVDRYRKAVERGDEAYENDEFIEIPNVPLPPMSLSDILPVGSQYTLDPKSRAFRSSSLMRDVIHAGADAEKGKAPTRPSGGCWGIKNT